MKLSILRLKNEPRGQKKTRVFGMVMNGLIIEFASISLGIVTLQPFAIFLSKIYIYSLKPLGKSFLLGVVDLLKMFVMAMKVKLVNSFIFMNIFLRTFMFGFHVRNFKWAFFAFLMLLSLNYILIVGPLCKPFVLCVNLFHYLLA